MKNAIVFECKRGFRSKGFFISCLIGCLVGVLDYILFCNIFQSELDDKVVIQAWIGTDFQLVFNQLYYVLFPILATLPFAGTYYQDLKSGYVKNLCIRVSRREYYLAKGIATFLTAQVAVMLPLLLNLMLCMATLPMCPAEKLTFTSAGVFDINLFSTTYHTYPVLYCILFILLDGVFAGILALYSICIAEKVESTFSAIAAPFAAYIISGVALQGDANGNWSVMEMVNPIQMCTTRIDQLLICLIGGIAIAVTIIIVKGRRKDFL